MIWLSRSSWSKVVGQHKAEIKSDGKSKLETKSPCIRSCCLDETAMCLGCYRALSEITSCSAATEEDKRVIIAQCKLRKIAKN